MSDRAAWQPSASLQQLQLRARMLASMRAFFMARGVMEVQTPILSHYANPDPAIDSFVCQYIGEGAPEPVSMYLHTSPEFAMKRLLAAGSGPIYQLASVFRQGELGSRHNPEFSMLEWYQPGFDHHELMREVDALVRALAPTGFTLSASRYLAYRDAFLEYAGIDPFVSETEDLHACVQAHGIDVSGMDRAEQDEWLDLLMSHVIEPALPGDCPVFIYDYPASQAALARIRNDVHPVAERFELYLGGMELANGFHELWDADEQAQRFTTNNRVREARGQATLPVDQYLLAGLASSEIDCAGVALGLDRLQMVFSGARRIEDVLNFSFDRA